MRIFINIFLGEPDMNEVVGRIKVRIDRYLKTMESSSNQVGEIKRMMVIKEQMMRSWDNDATVEKAIDRVMEVVVNLMGGTLRSSFMDTKGT